MPLHNRAPNWKYVENSAFGTVEELQNNIKTCYKISEELASIDADDDIIEELISAANAVAVISKVVLFEKYGIGEKIQIDIETKDWFSQYAGYG